MQFSFAIENMRRIGSMPPVPIRPITLLVGRNSAGKSTFLRTFPLIRQSLQTRTSAPLLWFGDLIDMGDFKTALNKGNSAKTIGFHLNVQVLNVNPNLQRRTRRPTKSNPTFYEGVELSFEIGDGGENTTVLNKILLRCRNPDLEAEIEFKQSANPRHQAREVARFTLNGINLLEQGDGFEIFANPNDIFGDLELFSAKKVNDERQFRGFPVHITIREAIASELKSSTGRSIGRVTLSKAAHEVLEFSQLNEKTLSQLAFRQTTKTLERFFLSLIDEKDSPRRKRLSFLVSTMAFFELYEGLMMQIRPLFLNSRYIGPARARGERYYRLQELEVSEIDPDGQNFPMFLRSLTSRQRENFSDWVRRAFGYGVETSVREGHVSIQLIRENSTKINIADAGYGISQILPVLGAVWWGVQGTGRRSNALFHYLDTIPAPNLIAIEQPELHLHPAHQAQLADIFVSALASNEKLGSEARFLIETHSESLINRLGELVEQKKIDPDDIAIVVFEGSDGEDACDAKVRLAHFDAEGYLQNWPHGFFSYSR